MIWSITINTNTNNKSYIYNNNTRETKNYKNPQRTQKYIIKQ